MDIEQRVAELEKKVYKASLAAGMALGLGLVVAVYAFIQILSN